MSLGNEFGDSYGVPRNAISVGILVLVLIISAGLFCAWSMDFAVIDPEEVGVVHKYWGGVQPDVLTDGLRLVWFGKIHKISVGQDKLTFADEAYAEKGSEDRGSSEFSEIEANCGKEGGQSAWITISVLYSIRPDKAVEIWNDGVADSYRYVILKRSIIDAVNRNARPQEALTIYSGVGFNQLRTDIEEYLRADENLKYFDIAKVTIYQIRLNEPYEFEIERKQLAKQTRLEAIELAAAAIEEANKAKAQAQVMVEQERAKAQAAQIEVIKAAEAAKEDQVYQARAKKEEDRLAGEGEKARDIAQAQGNLAYGLAEARVEQKLKEAMYEDESGILRAKVEVAIADADKLSAMLSGIRFISDETLLKLMQEGGFSPEFIDSSKSEVKTASETN